MEQKSEQSALITDHGDTGPFSWPPVVWIGVALCLVASVLTWQRLSPSSDAHYEDLARKQIWTTFSIGNPNSVVLANLRPSLTDKEVICGRINYEKINNGGWSGFTDFFLQSGVMYIAPVGGRYEKQFAALCLTAGRPLVDRPDLFG